MFDVLPDQVGFEYSKNGEDIPFTVHKQTYRVNNQITVESILSEYIITKAQQRDFSIIIEVGDLNAFAYIM
jgi:hypothetical protein